MGWSSWITKPWKKHDALIRNAAPGNHKHNLEKMGILQPNGPKAAATAPYQRSAEMQAAYDAIYAKYPQMAAIAAKYDSPQPAPAAAQQQGDPRRAVAQQYVQQMFGNQPQGNVGAAGRAVRASAPTQMFGNQSQQLLNQFGPATQPRPGMQGMGMPAGMGTPPPAARTMPVASGAGYNPGMRPYADGGKVKKRKKVDPRSKYVKKGCKK
jgi:hypothetical protein